jgi:polysaccharide biosynthesis protein PslJ
MYDNRVKAWWNPIGNWSHPLTIGLIVGVTAGVIAILVTVLGPTVSIGVVLGAIAGLYVVSNISTALYGVIAVVALLPFGTLPFRLGFTPTFLDAAMGAFLFIYALQWMTGQRQALGLRLTPVHLLIGLYVLWLLLAFALGLRYATPNAQILRQFVETLLSIGMVFVLVDLLREPVMLRRLTLVIALVIGVQALLTLVLYVLPDTVTESILVRLARIGYPNGGVIRYIEDNPANAERAIGTWVDPNALGGILAIFATLIAPQLFSARPIIRYRWLLWGILGVVTLGLILTFSRAAMLGFACGVLLISVFPGYRRFLALMVIGAALLLVLPQTRGYIERFGQAFTGADLATQMRLGEYGDALELISRYPISGIGFTGTPEIDVYTDVASMYLIMANQIGLVGVGIFGMMITGIFVYGWRAWSRVRHDPGSIALHLGYHAALLTALITATADLYYFRIDFHASVTAFWFLIALCLISSRMAFEHDESTVVKKSFIR